MNDIDRYYDHPLYQTYSAMIHRCYNPSRNVFESYGGRGICVEDRWLSFSNFIDDMGPTAESGLTVDRIDNDGNYGPGNCKWSTLREQRVNRRRFEGSTLKHKCISPHGDKHKVTVRVDGESHYLGLFSTEELAIEARDAFYNKVDQ